MTTSEANKAKALLSAITQRVETIAIDTGGVAVTAHWNEGGSKLFYDYNDLRQHVGYEPVKRATRKGW